jgi:phosphoribosylamine--glycine ligase
MKVMIIGSGGREHALCWAISQSPLLTKLYCAPGNAGIAQIAECLPIAADAIYDIVAVCHLHEIDFVVIGPEAQLEQGLADELRSEGIACFGPGKLAAEIESSKGFMKDLCARAGIPMANYQRHTNPEQAINYATSMIENQGKVVIKADGLAAGKGVVIADTTGTTITTINSMMVDRIFGDSGASVVIEEFMQGEEASFFALCDGEIAVPFTTAQDHKAAYDGDKGPNTGGMGAYSPAPIVDAAMQDRVMREIVNPAMKTLREMGRPFTGMLFAGLMITSTGPRLIEFNARFGDPETQVMMLRLKSDCLSLLYAASKGMLDGIDIHWHDHAALCVVMAPNGYPGEYKKGSTIYGLDRAAAIANTIVFHAGTVLTDEGTIIHANGGRVLTVSAVGNTIAEAQTRAYQAVDAIEWPEGFCRRDIGWRAIARDQAA